MSHPIRSVGAQLSLALLLVVAIALGIVYVAVVPSLENRLVNTRVAQLERVAAKQRSRITQSAVYDPDVVAAIAARTGARVSLMQRLSDTQIVVQDSVGGEPSTDVEDDSVAVKATKTGRATHGTIREGNDHYAEAAVPVLEGGYVLVLRDSVQNQFGSVHLVQRRLLLAAGAGLLIALLLGYGGAWMFARRIRRLESAADRIASGRFDEPVRDTGGGELRRLADAFERMRVRLAQLDDARREFVANASHELRTPLFSLGGFLELLDDEELDEATRLEFLGSMREQVVRLTKLASDLLDLTRLDAGRLTVEREPVDLSSLAEDVAEEFRPVARGTQHLLEVSPSEPAFADADELRVLQIARILVENALLHTPSGTAVQIRARLHDDRAALEVQDDSAGIPDDQRDQLFERFYRLEGTRASGSGLGLAIAKELAELMDGTIELATPPGRTVFTLTLPSTSVAAPPPFPREKALPTGS
ncbi:MAG TPA: HAMP domain-containing sensor histidine kinase [Gaiellaceae bacterium]|jgi:signal transduction histidine kinase|nr:HAMP domain-containing sensor histidine kinase [Gaiellaceae bacterium]